ncbi:scyllo-inositol 2-dehydrogenase (NADP(+)) [Bacillus paralicheniformis]|uniref:Scyllo-inositol 2-dehydrogenase (NADP(+)) n=4 Tax=Bacillus subtilis group TaxID=653685 RepID=A0ABY3G2S7_9BACI|nr:MULTISPECIES: Gfo/Idh/MocA family oxidoreductase [Bacillus]KUL15691.1 dehydrogenase [Bacillus licheniformis LMG 6934]MBG9881471.1 dehydrogenase [Bacillus paralicheniformis]MDE1361579.1 Gfo/Idh/MocA family oxidoreductase [Bacillus paralicheniformis]MDE1384819.1 Gfo/Idh/MocA family oxidoreductase [Bacillus paralicheniformis]MDE1393840.1 Gfo/Idh/MocA family oxidoreductase [Bacillus paralicheniformis]
MKNNVIKAGIIGGSLNNQWASQTHIPVLKENPFYEITAIGTSKMETAKKSAMMLKAASAFTDYKELAQSKDVDLVVVSIKVPFHYEASLAAIEENKHIYCEWPLGIDTVQAEKLAKLADDANIHHAIGLQGRQSPEVNYLKRVIKQGEIGKVISCTMQVATQGKGGITDEKSSYLLKRENGANLLTINGGHSLDVLCYILGDFKELSAAMNSHYTEAVIQETGMKIPKNTADQILIQGTLVNGASASVHIQGGVYPAFQLEIRGEKGVLRLTQHHSSGHVQFGNLKVKKITHPHNLLNAEDVYSEEVKISPVKDHGARGYVETAYTILAEDIFEHKNQIPNFHDAVKLHRLLDAIRKSAKTGKKVLLKNE